MEEEKLTEGELKSILRGIDDFENGRTLTSAQVREKIAKWLKEIPNQESKDMLDSRIEHYEKYGDEYPDFDDVIKDLEGDL